jgi:hypothetical protein
MLWSKTKASREIFIGERLILAHPTLHFVLGRTYLTTVTRNQQSTTTTTKDHCCVATAASARRFITSRSDRKLSFLPQTSSAA